MNKKFTVVQWSTKTSSYGGYGVHDKFIFPTLAKARDFVLKAPLRSGDDWPYLFKYQIEENGKRLGVLTSKEIKTLNLLKEKLKRTGEKI